MGLEERAKNRAEDLTGRGKEAVGAVTDDDSLKAEGKADRKKAGLKDKIEDVKDKVKEKTDDLL